MVCPGTATDWSSRCRVALNSSAKPRAVSMSSIMTSMFGVPGRPRSCTLPVSPGIDTGRTTTMRSAKPTAENRSSENSPLGTLRENPHTRTGCTVTPLAPRVVLVAKGGEDIVGFIAGHLTRRFGCDGELEWLDVVEEARRSGVAGDLLRALATWFEGCQARRICVDVDPQNAPARAFYRKHGAQDLNAHWLVWPDITRITQPTRSPRTT